jgi:hypothetical protein
MPPVESKKSALCQKDAVFRRKKRNAADFRWGIIPFTEPKKMRSTIKNSTDTKTDTNGLTPLTFYFSSNIMQKVVNGRFPALK